MIDFPASPTVGQTFSAAGVTWTWDGAKWLPSGLAPTVVGGIGDNRLINGDMRIDQRNNGVAVNNATTSPASYTVDRWRMQGSVASKLSGGRSTATLPSGFGYCMGIASNSAYALAVGDYFYFAQFVEADMVTDFAWGTPNAQPVTLSFWANSPLTGTFSGAIGNANNTRSYPFTYSNPAANVWTKIVVTIPGDTAGSWTLTGNGVGLLVDFDLGAGATFRGPAGVWASANYVGATGANSLVTINAATFYLTGVKLEVGSVATPYNRQSLAKSLADCQRYYQKIGGATFADLIIQGYSVATGLGGLSTSLGIYPMRAAPTATVVGTMSVTNVNGISLNGGLQTLGIQLSATAAGVCAWYSGGPTAYVTLSAEL